jgi:hypothetical protein
MGTEMNGTGRPVSAMPPSAFIGIGGQDGAQLCLDAEEPNRGRAPYLLAGNDADKKTKNQRFEHLKIALNHHSEYGLELSHRGQAGFGIVQVEWRLDVINRPVRVSHSWPIEQDL